MNNTTSRIEHIDEILDNREEVHKAADDLVRTDFLTNNFDPNHNGQPNLKPDQNLSRTPKLWEPQCEAFLDQHIFLAKSADAQSTYHFINVQLVDLSEGYQNFRVFEEEHKTVGHFLDETREGCYRIQCFSFNGKLGVNCTRLNGDSLAVCSLWNKLKQRLHEEGHYVDKFLVEDAETEDDEIFSSEDDHVDLDSFKFLDFSRDKAFVSKLIEDILDVNVGTHALMLIKFNLQKENNLQLVSDEFAQDLFNNTTERLSGQNVSLPVAVCAAHILTKMVAQAAITITFEQIRSILETAEKWCSESNPRETIVPTASEEASLLLTDLIPQALERSGDVDEDDVQEYLRNIHDQTDFDTTRDATEAFLVAEN